MNTKLAAFIIVIFSIFAIIMTVRIFRKDRLSTRLFLMWLFIWFAIGFFALFPFVLDKAMKAVNIGSRAFFITTGAILILYIVIFHISSNMSRMDRKISKLAQELAILNRKLQNLTNHSKEKR